MSILLRAKLNEAAQEYFDNLERNYGCIPENHQQAIALRMQFFNTYILDRVN